MGHIIDSFVLIVLKLNMNKSPRFTGTQHIYHTYFLCTDTANIPHIYFMYKHSKYITYLSYVQTQQRYHISILCTNTANISHIYFMYNLSSSSLLTHINLQLNVE